MTIADLVRAMEALAPTRLAAEWDNVGLLVGAPDRALAGPVLLTIDLTERVLAEAVAASACAIVAYHPPIFHPLRRLTTERAAERVVLGAAEARIAIYSPHTALDAIDGGMTDWLCEGLSGGKEGRIAGDCRPLSPHAARDPNQEVKIVTFVPEAELGTLRKHLAAAGAGRIGRYQVCSFAAAGEGTFFGEEGTSPAVGEGGRLERVREHRLEMVCSRAALALAVRTLREFHPYEEPAIDVYELVAKPDRRVGAGRRLVLDRPATLSDLAGRLKQHLGISMVKVAPAGEETPITHVGVCPGSGSDLAPVARGEGCHVFVTGEMTHHQVMAELQHGMSVILAGHTNTERGFLVRLAERIGASLPGVSVRVSQADRSPFRPM